MKQLDIEWRHYAKGCETCVRCAATGQALSDVVQQLTNELDPAGIQVRFKETLLPETALNQSNLILFNGVPLEELLIVAKASENACPSCACLTGYETSCRTVEYGGVNYEEIPAELVRQAAIRQLTA